MAAGNLAVDPVMQLAPLAFGLVAVTIVLHGFTVTPVARALGLSGGMRRVF